MPKKKEEKITEEKMLEIIQHIGENISDDQIFKIIEYYMLANGLKEINCFIDIYLEAGEFGMRANSTRFSEAELKTIREAIKKSRDDNDVKGGTLYGRS